MVKITPIIEVGIEQRYKIENVLRHSSITKIKNLLIFFLIIISFTACQGSGIQYDYDKQKAFRDMFIINSSRQDVEKILLHLTEVQFDKEWRFSDGDIGLSYYTSPELYGTSGFTFIFSSDLKLKQIIPQGTTD